MVYFIGKSPYPLQGQVLLREGRPLPVQTLPGLPEARVRGGRREVPVPAAGGLPAPPPQGRGLRQERQRQRGRHEGRAQARQVVPDDPGQAQVQADLRGEAGARRAHEPGGYR